jgi:hypothetical protein
MLDRELKIANLGPSAFVKEEIFGFNIKIKYLLGMNILYAATEDCM